MDEILECDHDGEFLTSDHTFEHCREIVAPVIGSRGPVPDINNQIYVKLDRYYNKLMESYEQPEVSDEMRNQVKDILCEAGADRATLDMIDEMIATKDLR